MIPAVLAAIVWVPAVLGLGSLVRYGGDPALRRAVSGMLGLGVLAVSATALHFVVPVSPPVGASLWLVGTGLFVARRRWLAEGASWTEIAGAASALVIAVRWMPPPREAYDSGLYYLQTVQWITNHALRPGLALLHERLGFNSAWHAGCAALEVPGLAGRSVFFANLLPIAFMSAAAAVGLVRLLTRVASLGDVAFALGFMPVWQSISGLGATTPDVVVSMISYFGFVMLVRALEADVTRFSGEARAALLLSIFAILVKVVAAPLVIGAVAAVAWRRRDVTGRWAVSAGALAVGAVGLWILRSVLLSGCALFPAAWSCVPSLPWALPAESVHSLADVIAAWARVGAGDHALLARWQWFGPWLDRLAVRDEVRLFAFVIVFGTALGCLAAHRLAAAFVIPYAVALVGIACVFVAAPAPRFAYGFLHAAGLLPLAFGVAQLQRGTLHRIGVLAVVVIVALGGRVAWLHHERAGWELRASEFPSLPKAVTEERTSASGLRVRVPVGTPGVPVQVAGGDQCWAAPEPCTPHLRPELVESAGGYRLARSPPIAGGER